MPCLFSCLCSARLPWILPERYTHSSLDTRRGRRGSVECHECHECHESHSTSRCTVRSKDRGFGSLESGAAAASRVSCARAAASPAIASSNDPRDADDVARPPSPSRLVSANTMTSPPSAADISAFPQTGNGGNLVPVPPQSDQSDQSNVPTNAPKHKVHKHAVQPATQIGKLRDHRVKICQGCERVSRCNMMQPVNTTYSKIIDQCV